MPGPPWTPRPRRITTWPGLMTPSVSALIARSAAGKQIAVPEKVRRLPSRKPSFTIPPSGARLPRTITIAGLFDNA